MSEADPLEDAWATLQCGWEDPARHHAFIELAAALNRLPDAATRYRLVENDPARAALAIRGKQWVLARAMAQLERPPGPSPLDTRGRGGWLAPLAALGLLLTFGTLLATLTGNRVWVSPPAIAGAMIIVALLPWRKLRR